MMKVKKDLVFKILNYFKVQSDIKIQSKILQ